MKSTDIKRVNIGLIKENNVRVIYEYKISLKQNEKRTEYISFVYDPIEKTFTNTDTSYTEVYNYNYKYNDDDNIYTYVTFVKGERLFYSFREYIDYIREKYGNSKFSPIYMLDETIADFENVWNNGNPKNVQVFCVKCKSVKCFCNK